MAMYINNKAELECGKDEIFLGNHQRGHKQEYMNGLRWREGGQAYAINGDKLEDDYAPVFLHKDDIENHDIAVRESQKAYYKKMGWSY